MYKIEEKCTPTRVDENKRLKLISAFQMMHDCDDLWIDSEPYAKEVFEKEHRAQLLAARQVDIIRVPQLREKLTISTSIYECKPLFGFRNDIIRDEQGEPCYVSYSMGAFIDLQTAKLSPLPQEMIDSLTMDEKYPMEYCDRRVRLPKVDPNAASFTDSKGREHKGVLKIDATCADAEMRYPVDVDIIHDGCRKVTDYIKKVCEMFELHKPRTNYKRARHAYLQLVKKAKKKGRMVRETIGVMLSYLHKDIRILMDLLAKDNTYYESLFTYEKRTLTAILKMYHQQEEMFRSKTHTCADRILSIFQPHVRAIVRGKAKARTEVGAKIGASIVEGYTFIDHHSWEAYNESQNLLLQIQLFKERFGSLPATILADKIYLNRANRDILEDFEIHSYSKPLGRPPKDPPSDDMKSRMVKAIGERNEIECSFGTGKRIYRANDIRAKLPDTARCWTGMCYFVKNVMKFLRELCLVLTEIWRFLINFVTMRDYVCYPLSVAGN